MSPLDAGWVETRASDGTGTLHYASNAMLERVPGIGSAIYEREQVQRERKRDGGGGEGARGGGEQGGKEERQGNAS